MNISFINTLNELIRLVGLEENANMKLMAKFDVIFVIRYLIRIDLVHGIDLTPQWSSLNMLLVKCSFDQNLIGILSENLSRINLKNLSVYLDLGIYIFVWILDILFC